MPRSWGYRTLRVAGGWRSAPLAFRPASFARRVGSKLGQALPQHLWPTPNQHVSSYNPRPLAPYSVISHVIPPVAPSNIEFASLELQRFPAVSKNYRLKLCAKFVWAGPARRPPSSRPSPTTTPGTNPSNTKCPITRPRRRPRAPQPRPVVPHVVASSVVVGGFAPCEALWRRVAGVSEAWMASFPPCGGEAALFDVRPAISHVIPLRVFQALKACCWNCSVCGASRKMTMLNYVRLWGRLTRAPAARSRSAELVRAVHATRRSRPFRCRRSTGACGRSAGAPRPSHPSPPAPPTSGHPPPALPEPVSRARGSA